MSIITTRHCDKCKKEVPISPKAGMGNQLWQVTVNAKCYNNTSVAVGHHYEFISGMTMDVCRPCLELLGIHVTKKDDKPLPTPPTLEEVIREIVSDEMHNYEP